MKKHSPKDKSCCDWADFKSGLEDAAQRDNFPAELIDWNIARKHWRTYSMTGYESFVTIKQAELRKNAYAMCRPLGDTP